MKGIVVVGSSNQDLALLCPELPRPGQTVRGAGLSISAGGKGANQAVAAARAGVEVSFVGLYGDDEWGEAARLEIPLDAVKAAADLAAEANIPFLLNPAPAMKLPAALLGRVHTLIPNETEAELLTGEKDPLRAAELLLEQGCRRVVITLGAKGAVIAGKGEPFCVIPAPPVQPLDTVGAGDCFVGWMAAGLAMGLPVQLATERAVAAASLAVTRAGAQDAMPYRTEVEQRR